VLLLGGVCQTCAFCFFVYSFIHSFCIPWILVGKKPDGCGISLHIHIVNGIKYISVESMCHIKTITIFINSSGNKISMVITCKI
jgi:hypothetical protein